MFCKFPLSYSLTTLIISMFYITISVINVVDKQLLLGQKSLPQRVPFQEIKTIGDIPSEIAKVISLYVLHEFTGNGCEAGNFKNSFFPRTDTGLNSM